MKLNTKNDVDLLMNGAVLSAALGAAIETGLLWRLATKPMSAVEVAQAFNVPSKRCHYWLQVMGHSSSAETSDIVMVALTDRWERKGSTRSKISFRILRAVTWDSPGGISPLPVCATT
jgi:hypothetical protein